jgi:hypothetical protein
MGGRTNTRTSKRPEKTDRPLSLCQNRTRAAIKGVRADMGSRELMGRSLAA